MRNYNPVRYHPVGYDTPHKLPLCLAHLASSRDPFFFLFYKDDKSPPIEQEAVTLTTVHLTGSGGRRNLRVQVYTIGFN